MGIAVGTGVPPTGAGGVLVPGVTPGSFGAESGTDRTQPRPITINSTVPAILIRYIFGILVALGQSLIVLVRNCPGKIGPSIICQYTIWLGLSVQVYADRVCLSMEFEYSWTVKHKVPNASSSG